MSSRLIAALCWFGITAPGFAVEWKVLTNQPDAPKVVAFNNRKTPPQAFPFLPERKKAAGFWTCFANPQVISKLAETATPADAAATWTNSGFWMHAQTGSTWVSLPVYESADHSTGSIQVGDAHITLHQGFWKNLQSSRPLDTAAPAAKPKTSDFKASLGQREGTAQTPDDRSANPFYEYKGDPANETASVFVPPGYDGSEPYGLIVFNVPGGLKGS